MRRKVTVESGFGKRLPWMGSLTMVFGRSSEANNTTMDAMTSGTMSSCSRLL